MASVAAKAGPKVKAPVYYLGSGMWIAVRLCEASAPVKIAYSKQEALSGEFSSTPFQAASGRHRLGEVKQLVREWVKQNGLG